MVWLLNPKLLAPLLVFALAGCSKPVDTKMDAAIQAINIQLEAPGVLEGEYKSMMCSSVRLAMSGLTMEQARIQDSTLSKFNAFADKCGIKKYKQ
jgi:hypothetical protein